GWEGGGGGGFARGGGGGGGGGGVGGGGFGNPERVAQALHLTLHDSGVERAAARAEKEGAVGGKRIGTRRNIIGNCVVHRRQYRHKALFSAFAGDRDHITPRYFRALQAERFRNTQTTAVKQCQERDIALCLPN